MRKGFRKLVLSVCSLVTALSLSLPFSACAKWDEWMSATSSSSVREPLEPLEPIEPLPLPPAPMPMPEPEPEPEPPPTPTPEPEPEPEPTPEPAPIPEPTPSEPDPNKTVERTETDEIGHKIAHYTDGTKEDLGRAVALDFSTPLPSEQYGYNYFATLEIGTGLQAFYDEMYTLCTEFHDSEREVTDSNRIIGKIIYAEKGLTLEQAYAVWSIFRKENPAYFWVDNSLLKDSAYLHIRIEADYVAYADRLYTQRAIETFALDCDRYVSTLTTETERALTVYDYLIEKIEYAYESDGVTAEDATWAHNAAGGALYGLGVCETYAETYDYFCGLFGLECLNVTGLAGDFSSTDNYGRHAWNVVEIDGVWYTIDATWGDAKYLSRQWFGKSATEFAETHRAYSPESGWGMDYQYTLPTLSESASSPVAVWEENGEATMYISLDKAFQTMTIAAGRYEINLYPQTKISKETGAVIHGDGASFSAPLPTVASLTFIGLRVELEDGEYALAKLNTDTDVTLAGNVTLENVIWSVRTLEKSGYMLTTKGEGSKVEETYGVLE